MNRWYSSTFPNGEQAEFFQTLNKIGAQLHEKVYYKIFTPKDKAMKYKAVFIADEGSTLVRMMGEKYALQECIPPERSSLTRVAGFSADRSWMFGEAETKGSKTT